jgi:glycosyltransferase involved in cell wall biosynthesis
MKILINTPFINIPGGVANHYLGLKDYFSSKVIYNQFHTRSSIYEIFKSKIIYLLAVPLLIIINYLKFIYLLLKYNRPIVLLNPSFGKTGLQRDALYLKIAKLFQCKVVVFIHGWDKKFLKKVLNKTEPFNNIWHKADAYFVLAHEFKSYLKQLGIKVPIHLTTTKVDDKLVEDIKTKEIEEINTILFLARVEKAKGVFETIDSFELLQKKHPNLRLRIVGNGTALDDAINYVNNMNLKNVTFTGQLSGERLKEEFINADLYILPTYGEGMPTSVLEAMAFGLPIISRPVGGLVDFFEDDKMGYLIESLAPVDYCNKIDCLINDIGRTNEIIKYNMQYAREHFMASKVGKALETQLNDI